MTFENTSDNTFEDNGHALIANVAEGMHVIDSTGTDLGTVEEVKMGEPGAATAQGQHTGEPHGIVESIVETVSGTEPEVPDELAEHLLRVGYLKVDGKGLLDRDRYVAADQIAAVEADTVHLRVTRDQVGAEV